MCLVSDMIHIYYIYTHIRSHFGSITILLELVVVAPALASFQSCMGSMEGYLSMSENHDLSNKDSEEDPVEEKKLNPYEKEWKETQARAQEMQKLLTDTKHRAEGELQEEHFIGFKTIPKTIRTMLQNDIHFLHVAFVRLYFDLEAPGGPITELWKLKEDMCKAQEVLKTAEDHIVQAYLYKNNTRSGG